jgi:hypothetical protein
VPLAGIEPALLAELDFESSASTNSATGAFCKSARKPEVAKPAEYSGQGMRVNPRDAGYGEAGRARHPAMERHPSVMGACLDSAVPAG